MRTARNFCFIIFPFENNSILLHPITNRRNTLSLYKSTLKRWGAKKPDIFIYASKGTTNPNGLVSKIKKAEMQKNSYTGNSKSKFAFVSYFPNDSKIFPNFTFVSDPFVGETGFPEEWEVKMSHYIKTFEFCSLLKTLDKYKELLMQKYKMKSYERGYYFPTNREYIKYDLIQKELREIFIKEEKNLSTYQHEDMRFIGNKKRYILDDLTYEIYLGLNSEIINSALNLNYSDNEFKNTLIENKKEIISIFSDGTILKINQI